MTQRARMRIAILGFGLIGPSHARSVLESDETELVAIVDPSPLVAAEAEKLAVRHFPDLSALLQSPDRPDAAIIATPNHTHVAVARALAAADVHMLIEKPLCTDADSGRSLIADLDSAAAERGVRALVGHHRRFNSYTIATKKALEDGSLGRVVAVNSLWMMMKPMSYFDMEWRRLNSAGPVLINMVHDVDLFHHFFGPIARVQTEATAPQRGFEAEEGAAIILRFASGVVASCLLSDNTPSPHSFESGTGENRNIPAHGQDFYRIFGTQGSLSVPDMTRWSYDGCETQDWTHKLASNAVNVEEVVPFDRQLEHFVRVVRGQEAPSCTPRAGLAASIVCEAIKESLKLCRAVDIEPYEL